MRPDERVIVFAHPRSGSTSLVRLLGLHPELRLDEEPFHEDHATWRRVERASRRRITDTDSLDAVLSEIFAEYDGFKTLAYQLSPTLNAHMLLAPGRKIVFLRRRNLLKSVVSGMIAEQTGLWHACQATAPVLEYYSDLRPLSVEEAAGRLAYERSLIDEHAAVLAGLPESRRLDVSYEDFFLAAETERAAQLERLFAFLDLEPIPAAQAAAFLDPSRARLNSEETYARVPNVRELDETLGSDEYGRLFELR